MIETAEESLNTSQVVSGLEDVITSPDVDHIKMFRTSRPLAEQMSGGPVRIQMQFSARASSAELIESLQSLVGNAAFSLLNSDFQKQGMQASPLC